MTVNLRLYSRAGCHLCEDAEQTLLGLPQTDKFTLEVVDIDKDRLLQREFALRIPVLVVIETNQILFEQQADPLALIRYLDAVQG